MTREEVWGDVTKIFRNVFDDDGLIISNDTTAEDIEDWDSLEHINLIVSMENEFSIKINIKEVSELKNVGDMVDLIMKKIII
jgi:acyl carrier protein